MNFEIGTGNSSSEIVLLWCVYNPQLTGSLTVCWNFIAGDWQMGPRVTPLDPNSVKSVVEFGTVSGTYTQSANGTSEVYSQIYPFEGLLNYTSGIIHHVRLTGKLSTGKLPLGLPLILI